MHAGMSWSPVNGIKQWLEPQARDLALGKRHREKPTHPLLLL